ESCDDVITHQVKLVRPLFPRGVDSEFARWQCKDEPVVSCIDKRKLQHVAEKRPQLLRLLVVDDAMNSGNHGLPSLGYHQPGPRNPKALNLHKQVKAHAAAT